MESCGEGQSSPDKFQHVRSNWQSGKYEKILRISDEQYEDERSVPPNFPDIVDMEDDHLLIINHQQKKMKTFELSRMTKKLDIPMKGRNCHCQMFRNLIFYYVDGGIEVLDATDGSKVGEVPSPDSKIMLKVFLDVKSRLLSFTVDARRWVHLHLWQMNDQRQFSLIHHVKLANFRTKRIENVEIDDRYIAVGVFDDKNRSQTVYFISTETLKIAQTFVIEPSVSRYRYGSGLLFENSKQGIQVRDVATRKQVGKIREKIFCPSTGEVQPIKMNSEWLILLVQHCSSHYFAVYKLEDFRNGNNFVDPLYKIPLSRLETCNFFVDDAKVVLIEKINEKPSFHVYDFSRVD